MRRFITFIKKLFRKKLKPKQYEEKEIVADGFVRAGDFLCMNKQNNPIRKD